MRGERPYPLKAGLEFGLWFFSKDWIDLQAIKAAFEKCPRGAPITSSILSPLFVGKSSNTQLFVWAILLQEGLVRRSANEKRGYERVDPGAFDATAKALAEGKGAPAIDAKKKKMKPAKAPLGKIPGASTKKKK